MTCTCRWEEPGVPGLERRDRNCDEHGNQTEWWARKVREAGQLLLGFDPGRRTDDPPERKSRRGGERGG